MTTTQHTAVINGRTYTRRSSAVYVYASMDRSGTVRWHGSYSAAHRAAGSSGKVAEVQSTTQRSTCVICGGTGRVGSRSAVTGETTWTACWGSTHRSA